MPKRPAPASPLDLTSLTAACKALAQQPNAATVQQVYEAVQRIEFDLHLAKKQQLATLLPGGVCDRPTPRALFHALSRARKEGKESLKDLRADLDGHVIPLLEALLRHLGFDPGTTAAQARAWALSHTPRQIMIGFSAEEEQHDLQRGRCLDCRKRLPSP